MTAAVIVLTAPAALAVGPDLDKDGLLDGLEGRVGLTPGRADRIVFVDTGSRGGRCSDRRKAAKVRSPLRPWCTLARAAQDSPAGATVLVRRGRYDRGVLTRARRGRVRLRAYPGERVVLRGLDIAGDRVELQGFRIRGGVEVSAGARRVSLIGNRFNTRETAIQLEPGVRKLLVADNQIVVRSSKGAPNAINFNSTDSRPAIVGVTIRDNRIGPITSGGDAIQAKNTSRLLVEDNEIFGIRRRRGSESHPDAFQSIYGSEGLTLRHNFIHDIRAQGVFVQRFRGENRRLVAEDNVITRVAYPWVPFGINAQGAKITHNTVDGLLRAGGRRLQLVANIATSGLLFSPEAKVARERYNLSTRFSRRRGPGSIVGRPRYRRPGANDFRLRRGSRGRRRGPRGTDIGARRANWSGSGRARKRR